MTDTFANLPIDIENSLADILMQDKEDTLIQRARQLHERYTNTEKKKKQKYLYDIDDMFAYLAIRVPATYAQIYGSLRSISEMLSTWKPRNVLDIGSGPGTGVWAAKGIWTSITESTCIEREKDFVTFGENIFSSSGYNLNNTWENYDLTSGLHGEEKYDLVIISNVLNELSPALAEKILGQAFTKTNGVLVIIEPGTPFGSSLVSNYASKLAKAGFLIAPYIDNKLVKDDTYWLHFSQRFVRPEFERRVRQRLRDSSDMASDWEEAKYSYSAISHLSSDRQLFGRVVGKPQIQKGFLEIPVLTNEKVDMVKVLKRNKKQYSFAKDLSWGDTIAKKDQLVDTE